MDEVIKTVTAFLTAPLLWITLVWSFGLAIRRVKYERTTFRMAIKPQWLEVRAFLGHGLLAGILISCGTLLLGLMIDWQWWLGYQIVAIIALLGLPYLLAGNLIVLISALVYWGLAWYWPQYQSPQQPALLAGLLVVTGLVTLVSSWLQKKDAPRLATPKVVQSKRGRLTAIFTSRQVYLAPVCFLVPGTLNFPDWSFWPVIQVGHQTYSIVILPLLLGFSFKAVQQLIPQVVQRYVKHQVIWGLCLLGIGLLAMAWPDYAIWGIMIAFLGSFVLQLRLGRQNRSEKRLYFTKPYEGVRVLGVQFETPAAKMGLEVGDVIVECNGLPVSDNENFYQAIQSQPTYCHLKVQDLQGEYRITESAVFADAPHELGVILFPED